MARRPLTDTVGRYLRPRTATPAAALTPAPEPAPTFATAEELAVVAGRTEELAPMLASALSALTSLTAALGAQERRLAILERHNCAESPHVCHMHLVATDRVGGRARKIYQCTQCQRPEYVLDPIE
jgi:hypothetical protein